VQIDVSLLRAEIANDPAGLGLAGMSDADIAEAMNAEREIGKRHDPITAERALDALSRETVQGIVDEATAESPQDPESHRDAVVYEERMLLEGSVDTEPGSPGRVLLDSMVDTGLLVRDDLDALVAAATVPIMQSRAMAVYGPVTITAAHVAEARK